VLDVFYESFDPVEPWIRPRPPEVVGAKAFDASLEY